MVIRRSARSGRVLGWVGSCSGADNKSYPPGYWDDDIRRHAENLQAKNVRYKPPTSKQLENHRNMILGFATQALNCFNQTSPQKYKLLKVVHFKGALQPKCMLYHMNFTAKHTDVASAPEEMFFTELTNSFLTGFSVKLCVSVGPVNSISGERLNGCRYCGCMNNSKIWHPKGGFVRGGDLLYKTVQDICDVNQNNAIPDCEKHLPVLEQVSGEPEKEHEYMLEQVDDASLYATEALKVCNQKLHIKYELVNPGFGTRVILPTCSLFHVNFKAKRTVPGVPSAPEELFFAELTSTSGVLSIRLLSPPDLQSGDETGDKTNGCYYCREFNKVRHPSLGGFVRGGDSLYTSEKEFCC